MLQHSYFLNICHVNLNNLSNKLNFVNTLLTEHNVDILGISESWLNNTILDSFIDISNYDLIRADSPSGIRKHGIAVYVKIELKYVILQTNVPNVVIVHFSSYGLYVITVYRPPSYTVCENNVLFNFLCTFCNDKEVVIQGDFNLPSICWNLEDIFSVYIGPLDLEFLNMFISLGLVQIVKEATNHPSGNIIDLFLCTDMERILSCEILPPMPGCSHSAVKVSYLFQIFFI